MVKPRAKHSSGETVSRLLNMLLNERNKPQSIVCDNGSEFTSKAMFFWAKKSGIKLAFIQPGKPTQNAFVESFNGKFRASCLDQHWFRTLDEARDEIEIWKEHYNHVRPHRFVKLYAAFRICKGSGIMINLYKVVV